MIYDKRMTAQMDGDFVIFLIGIRINQPWKFWKWMSIFGSMPKMLRELSSNPESGFLSSEIGLGRTVIMVQYWRSVEDLMKYAKDRDSEHLPAWRAFNRQIGLNGDVGIWHETYSVSKSGYEAVYVNMPKFGLARAGTHIEATGRLTSARGRLGHQLASDGSSKEV